MKHVLDMIFHYKLRSTIARTVGEIKIRFHKFLVTELELELQSFIDYLDYKLLLVLVLQYKLYASKLRTHSAITFSI